MFYDMQDLFDPNKTGLPGATVEFSTPPGTGLNFASNLIWVGKYLDSTNRYTFQRLLDSIGTGSAPEYGVYVYTNLYTNLPLVPPPSWLRTKVNINYDNTAQIQAGPYARTPAGPYGPFTPMPTNLVPWTNALSFFTNAADLLLRSQVFVYTNYVLATLSNGSVAYVPAAAPYTNLYFTFGLTNIPVYAPNNPGIVYNEQVHRILQLAANIYAAANPAYSSGTGVHVYQEPPIFRPQLVWSNVVPGVVNSNSVLYITGFVQVTNGGNSNAYSQIIKSFYDLTNYYNACVAGTNQNDPNIWGIPWVVGAVKGLPAFDQYSYKNQILFDRQLQFVRRPGTSAGQYETSLPFLYTNQFYEMSVSNVSGMDAWNPYSSHFYGSGAGFFVVISNLITVSVRNTAPFVTNISVTNVINWNVGAPTNPVSSPWLAGQFETFLSNWFVALPYGYYSESQHMFFQYTNGFTTDTNQTSWPTHSWTATVTNHLCYALFDGSPVLRTSVLLDFVNLGPFGSSFPISQYLTNLPDQYNTSAYPMWSLAATTDAGLRQTPPAIQAQIGYCMPLSSKFQWSMQGQGSPNGYPAQQQSFNSPGLISGPSANASTAVPYANYADSDIWMACDPLVHYTIGDLFSPSVSMSTTNINFIQPIQLLNQMTLGLGSNTQRYIYGIQNANTQRYIYGDPGMFSSTNWQFPTNLFPSVGWLGRVHRGTPWQTVYLKSDDPVHGPGWGAAIDNYTPWVNSPYTYPTNDWAIIDLFTTVPNDNAARGLLSVNQTNDAAWAAVFGGVIVMTNLTNGTPLNPTTDVSYLMDTANGINMARANTNYNPNGLFHKIGDILQASALTTQLGYVTNFNGTPNDEMVERIPQQTLGLLKLGLPQFVIYSWGQSLKPKNLYSTGSGNLQNICTNYEITGEYLTRTVCHIVSDPAAASPRIVIDNFNIEPGN
jgi:hypothetical protein